MHRPHFSTQMIVWIASSTSLLVLLISLFFWGASRQILQETTVELNEKILRQVERNLLTIQRSIRTIGITAFASHDTLTLLNEKPTKAQLFDRYQILDRFKLANLDLNPIIHSVYFFNNEKGIHYWVPRPNPLEEDRALEKQIAEVLHTKHGLQPFVRQLPGTPPEKVVSYVLSNSDNATSGLPDQGVVINLDLEQIRNAIDDQVLIFDGLSNLVSDAANSPPALVEAVRQLTIHEPNDSSLRLRTLAGEPYAITVLPMNFMDWTLVKLQPTRILFQRISQLQWLVVGGTLGALLLTLLLAFLVSQRLYRPVARLIRTISDRTGGRVALDASGDDFGYLQQAFQRALDHSQATTPGADTTTDILARFFLKKMLQSSGDIRPEEFMAATRAGFNLDFSQDISVWAFQKESPEDAAGKEEIARLIQEVDAEVRFEIVALEDHTFLGFFNSPLESLAEAAHDAGLSRSLTYSLAVGEGPVSSSRISQAVSSALETLRFCRMFYRGQVMTAEFVKSSGKQLMLVQTMKEILQANYRDPGLNLEAVAKLMNLTPHYIAKIFRLLEEKTISDFLHEIRVEKAAELLSQASPLSIKEIMAQIGVESESTFFRIFKARYGVTPREYGLKALL